jgi:hypothetical protein
MDAFKEIERGAGIASCSHMPARSMALCLHRQSIAADSTRASRDGMGSKNEMEWGGPMRRDWSVLYDTRDSIWRSHARLVPCPGDLTWAVAFHFPAIHPLLAFAPLTGRSTRDKQG